MSVEMHSTVPDGVRSIISSPELLSNITAGYPEVGIRLVSISYPDMHNAWACVCQHTDVEFPGFFFHCAAELPSRWRNVSKTPTKRLQRAIAKIAMAADALAFQLETHRDDAAFHRGSPLTFHHVMVRARTIRAELAGDAPPPDRWLYALRDLERHPHPDIPEFLRGLAAELRPLRMSSRSVLRPTKVGDKNAERTFMVRSLSAFLNSTLGNPKFDVVAVTVNTILDAKDDLLDANHARKLALDLP